MSIAIATHVNTVYQEISVPAVDSAVVCRGHAFQVVIPECPLASGSLQVLPLTNSSDDPECNNADEVQTFIRRIVHVWKQRGISDYLIYRKESTNSTHGWEIIPFQRSGNRFWKQFKVLWNVIFTPSPLPEIMRHRMAKNFQKEMCALFKVPHAEQIEAIDDVAQKNDAFCNPAVIDKQWVLKGKEVNVIYDYAPIGLGKEKLHFLIIPKKHRSTFFDLTKEEFLEILQLSQRLIKHYKEKGYHTAYLFNKTGIEAGQTVPHWHEHVIFVATKTQDLFGKLTVLKKMVLGASPLLPEEISARVKHLRQELQSI